jgi:hypothetical protein
VVRDGRPRRGARKQRILKDAARPHRSVTLRTHDAAARARGHLRARRSRLGDVLERAWKNGARFDSWDERLKLDVWEEAFEPLRDRHAPSTSARSP